MSRPSERRLQEYRQDVSSHQIPCGNLSQRGEVQKLMRRLDTLPVGPALKIGFLKSLMRARYAVEPLGHYGLSKAKYTHFTSPIRRYADLLVHRALFDRTRSAAASPQGDRRCTFPKPSATPPTPSATARMSNYLPSSRRS